MSVDEQAPVGMLVEAPVIIALIAIGSLAQVSWSGPKSTAKSPPIVTTTSSTAVQPLQSVTVTE